jgi:small nuclear ribonucleoprotein
LIKIPYLHTLKATDSLEPQKEKRKILRGLCHHFLGIGLNVKSSSSTCIKADEGSKMSEMTTEILEQNLGKVVLVRLKGGKSLRGRLKGFDQHLNLVLEETDDTTNIENTKKLGLIIVRGDNVVLISPPPR